MVEVIKKIIGDVADGELLVADGPSGDQVRSTGAAPVAFADGNFVPTAAFATPGDLAVAYTRQYGRYQRVGNRVHFSIYMTFTPTYTTAAGDLLVQGLPYLSAVEQSLAGWPLYLGSINNVAYQAGNLDISARIPNGDDDIQIRFATNAGANVPATVQHFPSGVQFTLTIGGSYPIDA